MDTSKQIDLKEQIRRDVFDHSQQLSEGELNCIAEALRRFNKDTYKIYEKIEWHIWGNPTHRALDINADILRPWELDIIRHALGNYVAEKAIEAQAPDVLEAETIIGVIDKHTGKPSRDAIQAAVLQADEELKALAVRDIEKESQQARDRFVERTKSMDSAQKYDAYSNCMMSTALLLVDRWGARFIPDICDALQLEQEELESTLNETDVLECVDLEGRETGTSAADDGAKSGTGAADPETVSEIMKRLNRVEESLHSIGQQVEAIWLKTGAVELDAESIAEDPEETEPEQ